MKITWDIKVQKLPGREKSSNLQSVEKTERLLGLGIGTDGKNMHYETVKYQFQFLKSYKQKKSKIQLK